MAMNELLLGDAKPATGLAALAHGVPRAETTFSLFRRLLGDAQSLQGIVLEERIELVRPFKPKDWILNLPENRRGCREALCTRRFCLCRKGRNTIAR
jgi:hypothetical protein